MSILTVIYKNNSNPVVKSMSRETAKKMFTDIYNACNSQKEFVVFSGKDGVNLFIRVSDVVECSITEEPYEHF